MSITKEVFGFPIIIPPHLTFDKLSDKVLGLLGSIDMLVGTLEMFEHRFEYGQATENSMDYVELYNEIFNKQYSAEQVEDVTLQALEDARDEWDRFLHVAA